MHQIHTEDAFGPSLRWVWRSRLPGTKIGTFRPFWCLRAVYVL